MKAKQIKLFTSKNLIWYFSMDGEYDFRYDGDFFIKDKHGNERLCLCEEQFFEYFESREAIPYLREVKLKRVLKNKN